jgi:hypothetical protein
MTLPDSDVLRDMVFGQLHMITTVPDADMKHDVDCDINGFRVAWRTRRVSVQKYGELSIRYERRNGVKTEYRKLMDGDAKPHLFVFDFLDAFVMASGKSILAALIKDVGYIGDWNKDGKTRAYYIPLEKVPHVLYDKS